MVLEIHYHPQSPLSIAVRILLRELGIECKEILVEFLTQQQKSEEYQKINPHQQVPVIKDDDFVLTESRAIAIYLCKKYDKSKKLYPDGDDIKENARMNSMLYRDLDHFRAMLDIADPRNILAGKSTGPVEELIPKRTTMLKEYDDILAERDYLFGNHMTILDMFATATLYEAALPGFDGWDEYPNLQKWRNRMNEKSYFDELVVQPSKALIQLYKDQCKKNAEALSKK